MHDQRGRHSCCQTRHEVLVVDSWHHGASAYSLEEGSGYVSPSWVWRCCHARDTQVFLQAVWWGVANHAGTPTTRVVLIMRRRQKDKRRTSRVKKLNADESESGSEYLNEDSIKHVEEEEESSDESAGEGDGSETRAMRELVLQQNRKKKRSGGFQSMGAWTRSSVTLAIVAMTIVCWNLWSPGLSFPVFKGIMKKGYRVPTPIQRKVRYSVLVQWVV